MSKVLFFSILFISNSIVAQTTYYSDIYPILTRHCTSCHSEGNIGPMPLNTYDQVASYATMIKYVTSTKFMPPFKADFHKVKYKNERSISEEEISKIEDWIKNGLLEGDSIANSYTSLSIANEFDQVICMKQSFKQFDNYYDQYQAFVLSHSNMEDKYVSQITVMPGNKEIVRSAQISVAKKGDADKQDNWDPKYGFYAFGSLRFEPILPNWYNWMPNTTGLEIDKNEVALLPANTDLILHIHYGPSSEIKTDSTCIGLIFDKENTKTQVQNVPLLITEFLSDTFLLEADLKKRITSSFYLPTETYIKSITPFAHLLCTNWEAFAILPDHSTIPLVSIKDWDFHWKEKYVFSKKILLPEGTRIVGTAIYDNRSENPYNPSSPAHAMKKGPFMFDENYACYFELLNSNPNPKATIKKPFTVSTDRVLELFFSCGQKSKYTLTVHDLVLNSSYVISERTYPKGEHTLRSSDLPNKTGRYAISISANGKVQDTWYFVIK